MSCQAFTRTGVFVLTVSSLSFSRPEFLLGLNLIVDELLDGTPAMSFEEVDGETSTLLPQYNSYAKGDGEDGTGGNSADEKLAKSVRWTVNLNLLIVRSLS